MITFALAAAGLLLLALGLLLPALLGRGSSAAPLRSATARQSNLEILRGQLAQLDAELAAGSLNAEQHVRARAEIERRALDEESAEQAPPVAGPARKTAFGLALSVPVFALVAYALVGNLQGLDPKATAVRVEPGGEVTLAQVEELVDTLAKRLESPGSAQAGDVQGWTMLARSYGALQRFPEASRAYARAIALAPQDAQLLADRADALAMMQGRKLAGEPQQLVEKALQIDPNNLKALAMAGSGAFESRDYGAALNFWGRARQLAGNDSDFAQGLDSSIAEARLAQSGTVASNSAAGNQGVVASAPSSTSTSTSTSTATAGISNARIAGRVSLAPALAAQVAPGDTVFIYARATEGPRMPLAILRKSAADLPITFTLDDSLAMSPQMSLSKYPRVVLGARVSRSGNAMSQAGDLQGQLSDVATGSSGLELVIDSVQP